MAGRLNTFREGYPFCLSEHRDPIGRRLHFVGTALVIAAVVTAIVTRNAWWLAAVPLAGYGFAWAGHFFFEKNRPAIFSHPLYRLPGGWVGFRDPLTGKTGF